MKAITLYEPWATLVALEEKGLETRGWCTKYRGPLAIHASKNRFYEPAIIWFEPFYTALEPLRYKSDSGESVMLNYGNVVAVCMLVACYEVTEENEDHYILEDAEFPDFLNGIVLPKDSKEAAFGDFSVGRYAWKLTEVKRMAKPIPARGHQRLWNWEPPEGVVLDG